jgi:hypothetical protein
MSERRPTWLLESPAFPNRHATILPALAAAGHAVIQWDDAWWTSGDFPRLAETTVVFHGSLGNAARIHADLPWRPGAFCDVAAFHCSAWYPRAREWLVHREWRVLPASELVSNPAAALEQFGRPDTVFVRPDSPLKPFAGRVLVRDGISLAALDHGFYYDDVGLPVVVAPVRVIGREWRYVVVDRRVVAGSAYSAADRSARPDDPGGEAWAFAADVAARMEPPERAYVLDVCEADGQLRLLELNPFSGADLYGCRAEDVVEAVSRVAVEAHSLSSSRS